MKTFDEAKTSCQVQSSDLLEIYSQNENQFITSLVASRKRSMLSNNKLNDPDCPAGWNKNQNQCYKFIDSPLKDWNQAQTICKNQGGSLASIKSSEENEYLANFGN